MKKLLICFGLLSLTSARSHAQVVTYSYDASGNRTMRSLINNISQAPSIEGAWDTPYSSRDIEIVVSPNPTSGLLSVKLSQWDITDTGTLVLSDTSGHVIVQQAISSDKTTIDISNSAKGIYMMLIVLNGEKHSYKIIKN